MLRGLIAKAAIDEGLEQIVEGRGVVGVVDEGVAQAGDKLAVDVPGVAAQAGDAADHLHPFGRGEQVEARGELGAVALTLQEVAAAAADVLKPEIFGHPAADVAAVA
ncbi:MAG: hypothetical protein IPN01_38580 [Deltaproteobacteria bacterium]|nr:hypothetical protein [Deltaproteobacteria bacterium]